MAKGFQCDRCERMFIGEPVKEIASGVNNEFKAVYTGEGDICRYCFIKSFTEALKPAPKKKAG